MSLPAAIFRNDATARQLVFDQPRQIIVANDAEVKELQEVMK